MEFKKLFENPEIEIKVIVAQDIITLSDDSYGEITLPPDDEP